MRWAAACDRRVRGAAALRPGDAARHRPARTDARAPDGRRRRPHRAVVSRPLRPWSPNIFDPSCRDSTHAGSERRAAAGLLANLTQRRFPMTTSFRIARSLLLSAAVSLALAACGGGGSGTQAGAPAGGTGDPGPGPAPGPGPGPGSGGTTAIAPVIFVADQTTAGIDELYMVDASAPGGSVKLSAPLVAGGNVYDFALSPDGNSVIYIADQDIDTRYELYRVSLATPQVATKLNPQLQTNRDVMDFVQTPDGGKV